MARTRATATRIRDAHAVEFRRRGLSYAQIAEQLELRSASSACDAVKRGMRDLFREEVLDAVQLELERLDDALRTEYRIMLARHRAVNSKGELVRDEQGHPVYDDSLNHQAAQGIKSLSESRRKLIGLDAPARSRVEVITEDVVDAELADLARQIAENDAAAAHTGSA